MLLPSLSFPTGLRPPRPGRRPRGNRTTASQSVDQLESELFGDREFAAIAGETRQGHRAFQKKREMYGQLVDTVASDKCGQM